jgi:DMSO/TMAO reductase YedYZ molybdopterin-dependent catalytic subunit
MSTSPPPPSASKRDRVLAARRKLRDRFLSQMAQTPSVADTQPQGSGPLNRHGMPSLPVGQYLTEKWPVLDLGVLPDVSSSTWALDLRGAVAHPQTLRFDDLCALEQTDDTSDMHCVTTWSKLQMRWRGVRFSLIAALADPSPDAAHVLIHASDGYTTNLPLSEALKDDVLLVHTYEGLPLPHEHGGPVRMITPQLYAWKGAKWICAIDFLTESQLGFWEQRGYSDTAHPWRNDRYSGDGPPPPTT